MTKEKLAEKLNGVDVSTSNEEYTEILNLAKKYGLVIVTGYSDDLIEFEGAFTDEGDCYQGDTFYVNKEGIHRRPDIEKYDDTEEGEEKYHAAFSAYLKGRKHTRAIVAEWCVIPGYSWSYTTSLPHATFNAAYSDDKTFCRGIVIDINDIT